MKLHDLVTKYITYRKALGDKFRTSEIQLSLFCKIIGPNTNVQNITEESIDKFFYNKNSHVTSSWFVKHYALSGLYRYALTRGYVKYIPLPTKLPKRPSPFIPYIYSKQELRQLISTALCYKKKKGQIEPYMIRTLLLVLYSTGLRISEALSLKLNDLDLDQNLIIVQNTKFHKSRFVPISDQLHCILDEYLLWRAKYVGNCDGDLSVFPGTKNLPLKFSTVHSIFQQIRLKAGVIRTDETTFQPRLHDLRHTFAVHSLISWYQENKDIGKLLPILSTYMGHSGFSSTTVYLSITSDLLNEASAKFEQYAAGDNE